MFRKKKIRHYLLLLLLLAFICGIGGKYFGEHSARQLQCNHVQLPAGTLPGAGSLKIAFFSDVHNNPELLKQAVEYIEAAKPDLIIFGGDLVSAHERFMRTRWAVESFKKLRAIAPVYAILGNHDYEKQEQVERVYATAGVTLLRNEKLTWNTPSGTPLHIVGLGDWNEGDEAPSACLQRLSEAESAPVLLLSHDPESRWKLRAHAWNLMLSGHTHGGQIGNPFTGEVISMRSSMPAGLFSFENNHRVFVTRGVGAILGLRFFCPPEVNILEVNNEQ